jgi:putative ABC transport system permease protein
VVDFTADGYVLYGTWTDMRRYFGLSKADAFIVKLASAGSYQAVKETLEDRYGQRRHIQVEDSRAFRERITKTTDRAFALFDVLVSIGMVVAALGVLNTLLMNILERTREIGGLRSLGMTRGQVARMILAEAGTMGAIGALLGLGMGLVLSRLFVRAMNQLSNYNLAYVFPTSSLIAGLGIALVVSQLAALYPAWRAARLRIVEAIQHE